MESDVLARVIQAEREIQAKIEAARKASEEQILRLKEDAEKRIVQEEAMVRELCRKGIAEADDLARKKAAALLDRETERAERLNALSDAALRKIVLEKIIRILPGQEHDRPHVQS